MGRVRCVALALAAVLVLGACGSSGSSTAAPTTPGDTQTQFENAKWDKAGPNPSASAKMVCQPEARAEIAASLGVKETRVAKPTWVEKEHVFSCTYVYPRGRIVLSVKELSSGRETTAYFERTKKKYGTTQKLIGIGQDAWVLKNSDVVVRKDYKVLLVDVREIPANFIQVMTRSDVALNIAAVIMSCWTGA